LETNATNLNLHLESNVEEKSITLHIKINFKSSKAKSESKYLLKARFD